MSQELAPRPAIYSMKPDRVWLRITNMETPGRFQVILEANDGDRREDYVIYDSIDECEGNIGHHHNLTWLVCPPAPESATKEGEM